MKEETKMKALDAIIAKIVLALANAGANTASLWGAYQPKEPDMKKSVNNFKNRDAEMCPDFHFKLLNINRINDIMNLEKDS